MISHERDSNPSVRVAPPVGYLQGLEGGPGQPPASAGNHRRKRGWLCLSHAFSRVPDRSAALSGAGRGRSGALPAQ